MGRGGVPNKVGGFIPLTEFRKKAFAIGKNMSIIDFIKQGCFEKDMMSYCATRLSHYSCIHWVDENGDFSDSDLDTVLTNTTSGSGSSPSCVLPNIFQYYAIQLTIQIIVPLLVTLSFISIVFSLIVLQKLISFHPLYVYLNILSWLDLIQLLIEGTDLIFVVFYNINITSAFLFVKRSTCQIVTLIFNALKQGQSALYVGLAIDSCRFIVATKHMCSVYRREWIHNVCILASVLILTMNAQFFWTFDVTVNENKMLHGRTVKRTFECGFSTTLPPNPTFARFIWPLMDHITGEVMPCVVGFIAFIIGWRCLHCRKCNGSDSSNNYDYLAKVVMDTKLIIQSQYSLMVVSLTYSVLAFCRGLYFLMKYIFFLYQLSFTPLGFRMGFSVKSLDTTKIKGFNNAGWEFGFEVGEYIIKICNLLVINVKFVTLLYYVDSFRNSITKWSDLVAKCSNLLTTNSTRNRDNSKRRLNKHFNTTCQEDLKLISFSI